ncbi:unannotated protein [freshwater metagenome]|uniref:Unannotated protein n=1 Tax=freshwater metagenome TaxID=449393 RepID=A0A6J6XA67_9ZZZZ
MVRGTSANELSIEGKATLSAVASKLTKNCAHEVRKSAYQASRGMGSTERFR